MKTANFQKWLKNYQLRKQVQMVMAEIEQMKTAYYSKKEVNK